MFRGCTNLRTVHGIENLIQTTRIESISNIINGCRSLEDYSFIDSWQLDHLKDISSAFAGTKIPLSKALELLNKTSYINNMNFNGTFSYCEFPDSQEVSVSIDNTKITSLYSCFRNSNVVSVSKINVPNCQDLAYSFYDATSLTSFRGLRMKEDLETSSVNRMFSTSPLVEVEDCRFPLFKYYGAMGFPSTLLRMDGFVFCESMLLTEWSPFFYVRWDENQVYDYICHGIITDPLQVENIFGNRNNAYGSRKHLLSRDSLLSIINILKDYSGSETSPTLNLGTAALARLTDDDISIATNKGWTLG